MRTRSAALAKRIVRASIRRPLLAALVWLILAAFLMSQAAGLTSEVGYPAYFGPEDPAVQRFGAFLAEFESGLHILLAFSSKSDTRRGLASYHRSLDLLARLQAEIDALPNARRTTSVLNAPIVVGPLSTRTLARRTPQGSYLLEDDWQLLLLRAREERFLSGTVISEDGRTLGLVAELQSLESSRVREFVHGLLDVVADYEEELGAEIFLAGDPVWTVMADDALDADSTRLTVLMFVVILGLLWALFRDFWITLLPVLAVGALTASVHGVIALLSIPMTSILAALPPLLVVIAIASSIHQLTAYLRSQAHTADEALVEAAEKVGPACLWAAVTTAGGFASFTWSGLESFRSFGLVAAIGLALSFLITFSLLPALLTLRSRGGERREARSQPILLQALLGASLDAVKWRPAFVLSSGVLVFLALATGIPRLEYEVDFGDQSFVLRSVRFMEDNLRRPMTTELVVSVPEGRRIYDPETLRILARLEEYFSDETSTGTAWSFLDFLEEAYHVDSGREAASVESLADAVPRLMPLVAAQERVASFWNETLVKRGNGEPENYRDRARISVNRSWMDEREMADYLARLRGFISSLNRESASEGYRVEVEGGLVLADLAVQRIRETQWRGFSSALAIVVAVLTALLWRDLRLLGWALAVNLIPVLALLGLMGWVGIGVDPANTMVAALLLAVIVDDTIHIALRYQQERRSGKIRTEAISLTIGAVGEAVVTTSLCLGLGFSVLMFSGWGGLVSFGLLASVGIAFALIADLLLLPSALLLRFPTEKTP